MEITVPQFSQRPGPHKKKALYLLPLLGALMFAAGLFALYPVHISYAATAATSCLTTSSNIATQKHQACDGQDPIVQGCATDAHTADHASITDGKRMIGRLELRFSKACGTYWGRVFSYIPNVTLSIDIVDLEGRVAPSQAVFIGTFVEIYSNMVWQVRQPSIDAVLTETTNPMDLGAAPHFSASLQPPPGN